MSQVGSNNTLSILQTLNGNNVAANGSVKQLGNHNEADVTQQGGTNNIYGGVGGTVNNIWQTSSTAAAALTNKVTISQQGAAPGTYASPSGGSDYNYAPELIGKVEQIHTGGAANTLTLTQIGGIHSAGNTINLAYQNGAGNSGTATQTGRRNFIQTLSQDSSLAASGNTYVIAMTGDRNGLGGLAGAAAAAGALSSSIVQIGGGNDVNYQVLGGDDNQFGFRQDGSDNKAIGITVTGDRNDLGVSQTGTDNQLSLGSIAGDDNNVGLVQDGTSNRAEVTITSSLGFGDRNGGQNGFTHSVPSGLTAGLLEQYGTSNSVTLNVSGNDNVFATKQDNSLTVGGTLKNTIVGTITGDDNEAAVIQVGNNNTTNFTQTGGGNFVSVSQ
jgi:hypothetical protein